MAKRKRKKYRENYYSELPVFELSPHIKRGILVVVFFVLGVLTLLAFFDAAGQFGVILNRFTKLLFGWAESVAPAVFFASALALLLAGKQASEEEAEEDEVSGVRVYIGAGLLTIGITGFLHLIAMRRFPDQMIFSLVQDGLGGGYLGTLSAYPLFRFVDFWGGISITSAFVIIAVVILFNINLGALFRWVLTLFKGRDAKTVQKQALSDKQAMDQVKINNLESAGFNAMEVTETRNENLEAETDVETLPEAPLIRTYEDRESGGFDYRLNKEKFKRGNWQLPPVELLEETRSTVDSGDIESNVKIIQKTLADFGIPVDMGEVNVGPTVTQYTLRPAQGIKLSQIISLQNDLALALAAPSIRIEAPIPGRSLVGIEVPNKTSAIVRLKDIVKTEAFLTHKSNLALSLGRDVAGHAVIADLSKMPHMLIAGATGTGKSVAINSMLVSFLYKNSPEELRLIVIDPKRVELNLYNGIPHLLTPVVTDHDKAVNSLKWAVAEMDRRYQLLAETAKRNILEYNLSGSGKLPYIVVVVDELADLMAVAQADVEAAVVRLAQMARAVGIHLVLATQRPSVDIITGLIKANITARVAFAVASQIDSRTILDTSGAEKLLGNGDMLFITAELGKPKRIQGTYISEREVGKVVEFVKDQAGDVEYAQEVTEKRRITSDAFGYSDDDDDDLMAEAVMEVRRAGKASASLLQRRLRIGYARAARLLDLMEEKGIVGPADGAKPRDVYISRAGRDDGSYDQED